MSRRLDTWYSLAELDGLARRKQALDGEIPLDRLTRLAELVSSPEGPVNATIALRARADGLIDLHLTCAADVRLICQRCLEPMTYRLEGDARFVVTENEPGRGEAHGGVGEDAEVLVLAGDRLNPRELIEEELLVSLPYAPRHGDERGCGSLARIVDELSTESADGDKVARTDR